MSIYIYICLYIYIYEETREKVVSNICNGRCSIEIPVFRNYTQCLLSSDGVQKHRLSFGIPSRNPQVVEFRCPVMYRNDPKSIDGQKVGGFRPH